MKVSHAVTSSVDWVKYFRANAVRQKDIPWHQPVTLSAAEISTIVPSLRGWQLGETSDGSHLLAAAHDYAARFDDPAFIDAARLFIAEEQRHGRNLGRFLDAAGLSRATFNWGDTLFRAVRYFLPKMELWATPVVMVETHALIYYNAIRRATGSTMLRTICEQILADEVVHIRFQCERLAILHRDRSHALRSFTMLAHRIFFIIVTLAVWVGHRHALRMGGYPFVRFWACAWARMKRAWSTMNPDVYLWERPSTSQSRSTRDDPHPVDTAACSPAQAQPSRGN
jgi:hypothetical protein